MSLHLIRNDTSLRIILKDILDHFYIEIFPNCQIGLNESDIKRFPKFYTVSYKFILRLLAGISAAS